MISKLFTSPIVVFDFDGCLGTFSFNPEDGRIFPEGFELETGYPPNVDAFCEINPYKSKNYEGKTIVQLNPLMVKLMNMLHKRGRKIFVCTKIHKGTELFEKLSMLHSEFPWFNDSDFIEGVVDDKQKEIYLRQLSLKYNCPVAYVDDDGEKLMKIEYAYVNDRTQPELYFYHLSTAITQFINLSNAEIEIPVCLFVDESD